MFKFTNSLLGGGDRQRPTVTTLTQTKRFGTPSIISWTPLSKQAGSALAIPHVELLSQYIAIKHLK